MKKETRRHERKTRSFNVEKKSSTKMEENNKIKRIE